MTGQLRGGDTRDRILAAARRHLSHEGVDNARIARIARDAGVSSPLVHYHFSTRETLLSEALRQAYEQASAARTAEAVDGPPSSSAQQLSDMVERCLPTPGEPAADWRLWVELWLRAARKPELRPTAEELASRLHRWFRGAIAEGVARGEFGPCDPDEVADLTMALIDGLGLRVLWDDPELPLERARALVSAFLVERLHLDGPLPEPSARLSSAVLEGR